MDITNEAQCWAMVGARNNDEWRAFLVRTMEEDEFTPDLVEPKAADSTALYDKMA